MVFRSIERRYAPASVPRRMVLWCLHCERIFRSHRERSCPHCGAAWSDVWRYYDSANGMPAAHWPEEAPEDGTMLPLYRPIYGS